MLHLCFWVTTCSHAEKRNRPTPQKPIITSISCKRFSPSKRRSWQVVAVRVHSWPSKIVISGGVCQDGYVENKFETSWKKIPSYQKVNMMKWCHSSPPPPPCIMEMKILNTNFARFLFTDTQHCPSTQLLYHGAGGNVCKQRQKK